MPAQSKLATAQLLCHRWAARIIVMEAETIAAELFETQAKTDALRNDINALTYCAFPGNKGPLELTATLHRALNVQPKPREESFPKIEPLRDRWLRSFQAVLEDPDSTLVHFD
jgi:hypothetical protein